MIIPNSFNKEITHRENKRFQEADLIINAILERLNEQQKNRCSDLRIIEFGSGAGYQIPYLKKIGNVIFSDIYCCKEIKEKYSKKFVQCSAESAPFKAETFDLIYSNHVLEHIVEITRTLDEVKRIGKSSCVYAFSVPTNIWLLLSIPAQYYRKIKHVFISIKHIIKKQNSSKFNPEVKSRKQGLNRYGLEALLPLPHGASRSFFQEFFKLRVSTWNKLFQENGFSIIKIKPLLLYGPSEWPIIPTIKTGNRLCSSVLFLLEKSKNEI